MNSKHPNPLFHVELLSQLPGLIVVMDKQSKFIFSNNYTARLFGYKNESDMSGISPHEMRCPAVASADDFVQQNQYVMKYDKEMTILDIHQYADGLPKILLTKKSPFKESNQLSGVICHCTEISSTTLSKICASLKNSDSQFTPTDKNINKSYTMGWLPQNNLLSSRELDCIFYLIRGKTMKETAKILGISHRTVETYLEQTRLKLGCPRKSDLIDYGVANGFLNYIPSNLLETNMSSSLS